MPTNPDHFTDPKWAAQERERQGLPPLETNYFPPGFFDPPKTNNLPQWFDAIGIVLSAALWAFIGAGVLCAIAVVAYQIWFK